MLVRRLLAGETTPLLDALPDLWRGLQLERLVAAEAEGEVLVQDNDEALVWLRGGLAGALRARLAGFRAG